MDERRVRRPAPRRWCPPTGSSSYSTSMSASGGLGGRLVDGRHGRHRFAHVADLVDGHDGPVLDGVAPVRVACRSRSAPVRTATTPGMASAARVSMRRMRACGSGERRTLPWSIPGTRMSPDVAASPRSFSRGVDARHASGPPGRPLPGRRDGRLGGAHVAAPLPAELADRVEDGAVAGTAAEVARPARAGRSSSSASSPAWRRAWMVSTMAGRAEAALDRGVAA